MPQVVLLPNLGADIEAGTIEAWLKDVGDSVAKGDVIAEVSTDKAVIEIESDYAGTMLEILVSAGTEDVLIDTPIATLLLEGETKADLDGQSTVETLAVASEVIAAPVRQDVAQRTTQNTSRAIASPSARRIAAELNVDLTSVNGSGPHGRIVRGDIELAAKQNRSMTKTDPVAKSVVSESAGHTAIANDNVRKVIARRLGEAKRDIPHFYLTVDFEIDALLEVRRQLNDLADRQFKLSVNDMIVKACALALRDVPAANSSWSDEAVLQYDDIDICVAVAGRSGLITPIVQNADRKGLADISREIKLLAEKARNGKLQPDEYQGGGFTISNLGMHGIREFSAIINPPQSCILAVGKAEKRAVVHGDALAIATVMTCTLSVDHRSVDGVVGAEYLRSLARYIDHPVKLIADGY